MKPQLQLPRLAIWKRVLPAAGTVLVSPGDVVEPDSKVAETELPVPPLTIALDHARPLVQVGQTVHAGVVVAERKKLLGPVDEVQSPIAGTIVRLLDGELVVQPPALTHVLQAQLPGSVAAVHDEFGVEIEGCYAIVRGYGGIGASAYGRLGEEIGVVVEPLTVERLQAIASQGVRGVIAPSWAEDSQPSPLPDGQVIAIFLTERLPGKPMAAPIAHALQEHLGQPAGVQAGEPPLLAFVSEAAGGSQCFGKGSWVRLSDGRTGKLNSVGSGPRFFGSGMRAVPAEVDLGDSVETVALDSLEWVA